MRELPGEVSSSGTIPTSTTNPPPVSTTAAPRLATGPTFPTTSVPSATTHSPTSTTDPTATAPTAPTSEPPQVAEPDFSSSDTTEPAPTETPESSTTPPGLTFDDTGVYQIGETIDEGGDPRGSDATAEQSAQSSTRSEGSGTRPPPAGPEGQSSGAVHETQEFDHTTHLGPSVDAGGGEGDASVDDAG